MDLGHNFQSLGSLKCAKAGIFARKFSSSNKPQIMDHSAQHVAGSPSSHMFSTNVSDIAVHPQQDAPGHQVECDNSQKRVIHCEEENDKEEDGDEDELEEDEDDGCDNASVVSLASTIKYEHEPFESFRFKAQSLIFDKLPGLSMENIGIERMKGGGFNRVVGVNVYEPVSEAPFFSKRNLARFFSRCIGRKRKRRISDRYILRIPRNHASGMPYDIATLEYAAKRTGLPIPKTLMYDVSATNPLRKAFMLQERLDGECLESLWTSLNFEQKKSAVRAICTVSVRLLQVTSKCAGIIDKNNTVLDLNSNVKLGQMPVPRGFLFEGTAGAVSGPAVPQSTQEFLIELVHRQRQWSISRGETCFNRYWDAFENVINRMHLLGLLPDDDPFYFCHGDFQLRNILATVVSPVDVMITGIIDWDMATFAPKFMSNRAPFFLWDEDDAHDEDEENALMAPLCTQKAEFKRIYEETVGTKVLKSAYSPTYVLARRMYYILTRGFRSGADEFYADEIITEFETLHPQ